MKKIGINDGWSVVYENIKDTKGGSLTECVNLPHDASIKMKREPDAPNGHAKGYYPNIRLSYKKELEIPREYENQVIHFHFDGIYMNARVWINGMFAGNCFNGYDGFTIKAHHLLKAGENNELKIEVQSREDSRWYSGSGIYRNAYMLVGNLVHLEEYGVKLRTREADEEMAAIEAQITISNQDFKNREVGVETVFADMQGNEVVRDERRLHIFGGDTETLFPRIYLSNPKLWSVEEPNLYQVTVRVIENDQTIDEMHIHFGVRTMTLDLERGLRLNGKAIKLYGGCIHHDNGIIGAATFADAEERRIRILKEAGYNAIRSSHHPISEELLNACDKYGMLVWDELSDTWNERKSPDDTANYFSVTWRNSIRSMVEKDYNHPSVIIYSIGNEVGEIARPGGMKCSRTLANEIRKWDDSRYITKGINSIVVLFTVGNAGQDEKKETEPEDINFIMNQLMSQMNEIQCQDYVVEGVREAMESLDIVGYNYAEDRYLIDSARFTNRICVGSETYPKSIAKNWRLVEENANVIGDFGWTAWDYLGETGVGKNDDETGMDVGIYRKYPYYLANCGDIDIIGHRRTQSFYREIAIGRRRDPYIAVLNPEEYGKTINKTPWSWSNSIASWNWKGYEGKPIQVEVYAQGDQVELFVNGVSAGKKDVPQESKEAVTAYCMVFDVVYQPGTIEAVVYRNSVEQGRFKLQTANEKRQIVVREESGNSPESELLYFYINVEDEHGNVKTDEDMELTVSVEGAGHIQGFGSSDPCSEQLFGTGTFTTYYGRSLLVVKKDRSGKIQINISGDGIEVSREITVS